MNAEDYANDSAEFDQQFSSVYAGYGVTPNALVFAFYTHYDFNGYTLEHKGVGGEYSFGAVTVGAALAVEQSDEESKFLTVNYAPIDALDLSVYAGWDDGDDDVDFGILADATFGKFDFSGVFSTMEVARGDHFLSLSGDYQISDKFKAGVKNTTQLMTH